MTARPDRGNPWSGMSTGWAIISTLIAGMAVWGGVGFLIDVLAGTDNVFLALGLVLGAAAGIYLVYIRYGRE